MIGKAFPSGHKLASVDDFAYTDPKKIRNYLFGKCKYHEDQG